MGDGTLGWPEEMPFDAIIVTAGAPKVPRPLTEQLALGGRLVIPVGDIWSQTLTCVRKTRDRAEVRVPRRLPLCAPHRQIRLGRRQGGGGRVELIRKIHLTVESE